LLGTPPPDLSDPTQAGYFSGRAKLLIVVEGSSGTPMIGWGQMLGEQERLEVLHFMETLVRQDARARDAS